MIRIATRRTALAVLTFSLTMMSSFNSRTHAEEILFLGGGAGSPTSGDDQVVFDYLTIDLGHDVTYLSGNDATETDGLFSDLIIISSTLGSGSVRGKFQFSSTPILNWEEAIMRGSTAAGNLSMGVGSANGGALTGTDINIVNPAHPLAAGLSGIVTIFDVPNRRPHITGTLPPGVIGIAEYPPSNGGGLDIAPSGTGMHVGTTQNGTNPFAGFMDEISIWDRSLSFEVDDANNLTGGEIHTIHTQGVGLVPVANPGPTAYWAFENQADPNTALDDTINFNDGEIEGGAFQVTTTAAPGVGGLGSLELDGFAGSTMNVPTMERPGGEFAYSFWFNADSLTYGDTFDTQDPRVDFFYGNGNGGTVRPHLSANRGGRPIGIYVAGPAGDLPEPFEATQDSFTTDEWHHIVISWDGEIASVFVDGVLDNQFDSTAQSVNEKTITAVELDGELADGTLATSRRVNFPIENVGFASLTPDGLKLFDASIDWLLGKTVAPLEGDVNGDGQVNEADFQIVAANYGTAGGASRDIGDLTGDGNVGLADLSQVQSNFDTAAAAAAVPEPSTYVLLLLSLAGLASTRLIKKPRELPC